METSLPLRQVADDVCVAPQLTPDAMTELARLGFRSVVNNRPDFEHGPDQPTSEAIAIAMAKNPLERFPTYDDFIMALTAARSKLLVNTYRDSGGGGGKWWKR